MIYTSRYSNPELKTGNYTVVGITRGAPKFPLRYTLAGNIMPPTLTAVSAFLLCRMAGFSAALA